MDAESLLIKYRPQYFDQVLGHDAVLKSLEAAIKAKRSQAYLLAGPSGTGKTTLARIAARALGCAEYDIHETDAATDTGIDDMRTIVDMQMYQPMGGGEARAVIVDEAHALSKAAKTSLLKTLEEPPPWTYWFLCTTDPAAILPTVRTRCLTYTLKPVARAILIDLLTMVAEEEGLCNVPQRSAIVQLCAYEAEGSPRQALANLAACAEAATRAEAAELLAAVGDSAAAVELARELLARGHWKDVQKILTATEDTPETIRRVVCSYMAKIARTSDEPNKVGRALEVLDIFSDRIWTDDGALVLACGRCLLGRQR